MNYSGKIKLRYPVREDGTCQIRLQIILGAKVWPMALKLCWSPELFDEELRRCLTSQPAVQRKPAYRAVLAKAIAVAGGTAELPEARARDYNLLIGQALAKANEVFVTYRLSKQVLTLEQFQRDFNMAGSRSDFITYYEAKMTERYRGVV